MNYTDTIKEISKITGTTQEDDGCFHVEFKASGSAMVVVFVAARQDSCGTCSFDVFTLVPQGILTHLTASQVTHLSSLFVQAAYLAGKLEAVAQGQTWSGNEVSHYWKEKARETKVLDQQKKKARKMKVLDQQKKKKARKTKVLDQ